jgi:tRNA-splicing ligase RtcB
MSRTKALQSFTGSAVKKLLEARKINLLSAGLDEVPDVYKDIATVMAGQTDLVDVLRRFDPKLVKVCLPANARKTSAIAPSYSPRLPRAGADQEALGIAWNDRSDL